MRMPKTGGILETLASGQDGANGIAMDSTHVYWTSAQADTISRLPRCACGL